MSRRDGPIRLATRGSELARRQTALVREALEDRRYEVEVVEVETRGDEVRDDLIHRLGKTGAFVRALDEKVLDGDVDAAVHSMKDVPTEMPEDLVVAAVPERASPGDALVTPDGATLDELPEGATVGTSSLRRKAQLLAGRPDLDVRPLRGNVDTRVEKLLAPHRQAAHQRRLDAEAGDGDGEDADAGGADGSNDETPDDASEGDEGTADAGESDGGTADAGGGQATADEDDEPAFEQSAAEWFDALSEIERRAMEREVETEYDAVVLAVAGLERSGLADALSLQRLPTGRHVPAPGQGTIAVTGRDDEVAEAIHSVVDHPRTRVETTVERVVLAELGGGCIAPIGVYAHLQGEGVHVTAGAYSADGTESATLTRDLPVEEHVEAAREAAADLAEQGARELVAAARDDE